MNRHPHREPASIPLARWGRSPSPTRWMVLAAVWVCLASIWCFPQPGMAQKRHPTPTQPPLEWKEHHQDTPTCVIMEPPGGYGKRGNLRYLPWTNGTVYYQFDPAVSQTNRERMRRGMDSWEARVNVRFVPRTGQPNYIYILNADVNTSFIGMNGGRQELKMHNWSNKGVILHELGHALGLHHEHQRSDRNTYITVLPNTTCDPAWINHLKGTRILDYDF